jgi:hypothetical protein
MDVSIDIEFPLAWTYLDLGRESCGLINKD